MLLDLFLAIPSTPDTGTSDPFHLVLSYGPLGLMVLGFVTGQLVPGYLYKRTEAENDRLRKLVEDKVIPLVEQNAEVTERAITVIREVRSWQPIPPQPSAESRHGLFRRGRSD